MKKKKKHAFTLAEILITLSIIGVVAALTIPTLIQRTGNEEYVSRLIKAYSTFSQAAEAIMTEQGSPRTWASDVDRLYNAYKEKLRISKDCGSGAGCFIQTNKRGYTALTYNNDTGNIDQDKNARKMMLSDGMQAAFYTFSPDCVSDKAFGRTDYCALILIDINGTKGPNAVARDVFRFYLTPQELVPAGCEKNDSCATWEGWGCACEVIREGAMNY